MNLPRLPSDKEGHLLAGVACFCLFGLVSPLAGLISAIVAGAAKELYDWYTGKGNPELLDFVATVGGGLVGFYCTYL